MSEYKNYIFDLYGTLVDIRTREDVRSLWQRTALYYAVHGAAYAPAELRRAWVRLCGAEQNRDPDPFYELELRRVFRALYEEKGVRPEDRLVEETAVFFRLCSVQKLRLYPWVKPVLARLRRSGAGIFLLSNAQACFTRPELAALGIAAAFDAVALSSEAGVRKPSPAFLKGLLSDQGLAPEDCLLIGNDQRADVAVARACAVDCLYIQTETSGPYDPAGRADRELRDGDFSRLPELLGL